MLVEQDSPVGLIHIFRQRQPLRRQTVLFLSGPIILIIEHNALRHAGISDQFGLGIRKQQLILLKGNISGLRRATADASFFKRTRRQLKNLVLAGHRVHFVELMLQILDLAVELPYYLIVVGLYP